MERQAKEDAIKRGLGSFGPQSAWLAGLMAPSSGITDTLGLYPADTSGSGEKLPSFGENIQNKQYLDALYQGLGLAGDAMYATTPLTGPLGILGGTALKGMGAVGKATKASKSLKSKKYGDYLYHITPTKNVKSIKERGLSPIETSNYTKGRALDDPYQEDPRVFAWTNPVDAMHFLNRMHGPFGTNNMDEFSILRIRKTNGGKWEKDLALDPHMAYSNVDEIQKATGEKGLVSVQTGSYEGIDSDDIIDHIEVKYLQKELGDFIPSDLVYPGKGSYTGVEYSDAVTDLMNKGGISKATEAQKPIKAYHGSPHDFEKFDIGKIGSGEGFQAFGRGIYFAEAEDVAKGYQKGLGTVVKYDGKTILKNDKGVGTTGDKDLDDLIMQDFGDMDKAIINAEEQIDVAEKYGSAEQFQWWRQNLEKLKEAKPKVKVKKTGKVYETDIHATADELLDWDKPLSKQPKAVQKKLDSFPKMSDEYDVGKMNYRYHFFTKEDDLLDTELPSFKTEEEAMHFLNDPDADEYYRWLTAGQYGPIEKAKVGELDKAGIKGIKYLDGFSRGTEGGTSNYVIFDDRVIDISKKYGVAIPVAGAMLLSIDKGEKAIEGGRKDI